MAFFTPYPPWQNPNPYRVNFRIQNSIDSTNSKVPCGPTRSKKHDPYFHGYYLIYMSLASSYCQVGSTEPGLAIINDAEKNDILKNCSWFWHRGKACVASTGMPVLQIYRLPRDICHFLQQAVISSSSFLLTSSIEDLLVCLWMQGIIATLFISRYKLPPTSNLSYMAQGIPVFDY